MKEMLFRGRDMGKESFGGKTMSCHTVVTGIRVFDMERQVSKKENKRELYQAIYSWEGSISKSNKKYTIYKVMT